MKRAVNETVDNLVNRLPEELIEAWQERAGIREYDAGLSRPHAEALALLDLLDSDPDVLSNLRAAQIDAECVFLHSSFTPSAARDRIFHSYKPV